ncbi:MAG: hypothetical protein R3C12_19395 [Planctomycetaceae bacterium]
MPAVTAVATAEFTGAVILEADLELTASGAPTLTIPLSGDAGGIADSVSVTDLTFAAAVQDLDTLAVQTADTITLSPHSLASIRSDPSGPRHRPGRVGRWTTSQQSTGGLLAEGTAGLGS